MPQQQAKGLGPNFPEDSRFFCGITFGGSWEVGFFRWICLGNWTGSEEGTIPSGRDCVGQLFSSPWHSLF